MGRYRPPQQPGSNYITPEGYQRLYDELNYLWRKKRPKVTRAVSEAAAQGDRSENADYIYGKKLLREIDSRVRFLRKRLDHLQKVDRIPDDTSVIYFGAWVKLEDDQGNEISYRIVGPDEFDTKKGWISMDSPVAKALMKKTIDDEVRVQLPDGDRLLYILAVQYEPFNEN